MEIWNQIKKFTSKIILFVLLVGAILTPLFSIGIFKDRNNLFDSKTAAAYPPLSGPSNILTLGSPSQKIKGFGVSSVDYFTGQNGLNYNKLTPSQRAQLDNPLLDDLKINTMRYWADINDFKVNYGILYQNIKSKVPFHLFQADINQGNFNTEPAKVALGIKNLKQDDNIILTHVSLCNECSNIPKNAWPTMVINLKNALVNNGLLDVKIVATEGPNNDDSWMDKMIEIKNNTTAWAALDVLSSHSYAMAMRPSDTAFKNSTGKEWWIGESGANGTESLGDTDTAAQSVAKALHDFNMGADNWIWFIGHAPADPVDDKTRLIRYTNTPFTVDKLEKFYYFKHFRQFFPNGSTIYNVTSNLENEMPWTYQNYAKLQAVGAKNIDGSFSLGVVNYSQTPQQVSFQVPELAGKSNISAEIYKSSGPGERNVKIDTVPVLGGKISLPFMLGAKEFVTIKTIENNSISSNSSSNSSSFISSSSSSISSINSSYSRSNFSSSNLSSPSASSNNSISSSSSNIFSSSPSLSSSMSSLSPSSTSNSSSFISASSNRFSINSTSSSFSNSSSSHTNSKSSSSTSFSSVGISSISNSTRIQSSLSSSQNLNPNPSSSNNSISSFSSNSPKPSSRSSFSSSSTGKNKTINFKNGRSIDITIENNCSEFDSINEISANMIEFRVKCQNVRIKTYWNGLDPEKTWKLVKFNPKTNLPEKTEIPSIIGKEFKNGVKTIFSIHEIRDGEFGDYDDQPGSIWDPFGLDIVEIVNPKSQSSQNNTTTINSKVLTRTGGQINIFNISLISVLLILPIYLINICLKKNSKF